MLITISAHISNEHLSDGNSGKKISGRLELLRLCLESLNLYNDLSTIPILVLDTGDMQENNVMPMISEYGFTKITTSSRDGFYVEDFPKNDKRIYVRYHRQIPWSIDFKDKAHRFLESCIAAIEYSTYISEKTLIMIEGDTILFGNNYIEKLQEILGNYPIAGCDYEDKMHTDFWVANVSKIRFVAKQVYNNFKPPYHSEESFAKTFTDRLDLNEIFIGEKSLDQLHQDTTEKRLTIDYFVRHPYSWTTHLTKNQILMIEAYFNLLSTQKSHKKITHLKKTGMAFVFWYFKKKEWVQRALARTTIFFERKKHQLFCLFKKEL